MGSMLNVLNAVIFPFAFPEIRDTWVPAEEFTPNKNRVNRQSFSNLRESLWQGQRKEKTLFVKGDTTHAQKGCLESKLTG